MNLPLNINWQQILLHLFNFSILGGGLYFLLYAPVKKFMDKRTAYYHEMQETTQQKIYEAQQLREQYAQKLCNAEDEIRVQKEQALQAMQRTAQQRTAEAERQAQQIIAAAHSTAEHIREKIIEDSRTELESLAIATAKKLVLQSDTDAFDQFLDTVERGDPNGGT